MRLLSSALLACALLASIVAQPVTATAAGSDKRVTLTGCLVKGEDGGLLLTESEGAQVSSTTTTTAPAPGTSTVTTTTTTTTTTRPAQVLYWLDDDDELDGLSGRRVELTGELEGDVKKGELEIDRKDNGMIELEAKFGDRKITARLPHVPAAVGTAGAVGDRDVDIEYVVRKVDVKSVRMIADSCR